MQQHRDIHEPPPPIDATQDSAPDAGARRAVLNDKVEGYVIPPPPAADDWSAPGNSRVGGSSGSSYLDRLPSAGSASRFSSTAPGSAGADSSIASQQALIALIQADGDLTAAASRLHTIPANVVAAIVGDASNHDLLAKYLRAFSNIKLFGLINNMQNELAQNLDKLKPGDLARTYSALLIAFQAMTQKDAEHAPTENNTFDKMVRHFPPHVREALTILVRDGELVESGAVSNQAGIEATGASHASQAGALERAG